MKVTHLGLVLTLAREECYLDEHYSVLAIVRTRRYGLALAYLYGDTPDRLATLLLSGGRCCEIANDTTSKRPFVAAYVSSVQAANGEPLTPLASVLRHHFRGESTP